uniref:Uncharacterized protein n=1 Tax=Timema poppense TaxID=170557 RepID=A0A7R9H4W9_TIMPO|nr:unnamed protein product [Timema poppensis]
MALFYMVLHHDVNSPYQMLDAGFVYLEGNLLENLPDNLFVSLPVLKWLDVRNNKLTQFPKSVAYHDNLQVLLLQGNQIQRLPLELVLRSQEPLLAQKSTMSCVAYLGQSPTSLTKPEVNFDVSSSLQYTVQISMEVHCKVFPGYPISRFGDIAEPLRSPGLTGGHKERILVEVEALHKVMSSFEEYIQQ